MKDIKNCDWLKKWQAVTRRFAFQYNPALQPRAIVVFGCISKQVTDSEIKQLLRTLMRVGTGTCRLPSTQEHLILFPNANQ
jgi:neurofibromin 1